MNPTDDTKGFPRLPFNPTPSPDLVAQAMAGAKEDPAEAMRRVVALIVQHMGLQQRNNDFSARFWGTADVSEENAEHWQYLRNANFAIGVTASGAFKWVNNAALQAAALTTSMPYGVPRGITVQDQSAAKNWLQQSVSATGSTWYVADGWVKRTGGTTAGVDIVENSGSTTSRTHSVYFPTETNNPWRRLGDHRNPAGLTFKTYKGTTKLTFRTVVAANGTGQFAQMMLEKGRRRHPWRLHFMERGNLITSLKTAGSASWTGNIRLSASGGAIVRQVATKTFVYGTRHTATLPVRVSTTGAVGTAATLARSDHRHRGVPYIDTAGSASASGPIRLSGSGAVTIRQKAGPPRTFVIRSAVLASTTPAPVSGTGTVGVGTTAARADHVHSGVRRVTYGGQSRDGTLAVSGSGTGWGIAWTGQKLKLGFPKPATATPSKVSTSGTVGTSALWARSDHRHRGVPAIRIRGAQGSASGTVRLSQSSNVTIRRSGQTVIVGATGGGSLDINGLTAADPALGDESPIYDISAAANRKVTIQEIAGFGAIGVSELRLSLTSGLSVTTADVTAAGTIYLTPHVGNRIRIYDGTRWNEYQTAEVSLALTLTSGKNYDVWAYDSGGTVTLEVLVWTDDTTRATALTTQDGVYVKTGATTRLYLGTIRASATNQTEDSAAKRFVWNMYNRVPRAMRALDATDSWNYTTATIRQANANTANQIAFVRGIDVDSVHADIHVMVFNATNIYVSAGFGLDSTTTMDTTATKGGAAHSLTTTLDAHYSGFPGLGYHYLTWLEHSQAAGTTTWYGDNGTPTVLHSGITGTVLA